MTISTTTDKTIASGNGATTVFNYNFLIQANSQMVVIFTDANGNQTTLSPAVYSVTGAGNPTGGTVTYPLSGSPIATGTTLTMFRTLTLQQLTSLKNQGSFNPAVVEAALDYLMMTAQQLNDTVGRSIVAPIVDSNPGVVLPPASQRKNLSLGFDANGNVALVSALNSLSVSGYAVLLLQQASAAAERAYLGSTTVGDAIFVAANATAALNALGFNTAGIPVSLSAPISFLGSPLVLNLDPSICNGRLTLSTGVPVTTSDVTGATTLYFSPYKGNRIALYDGSANWKLYSFSELSIAVPSTTSTIYDVFCFDNSGVPTLELASWTNDTTRATAVTFQNGILVKSGSTTRRYLGSIRTTTSSGQSEDSITRRYVWNYYNRVRRSMRVVEATSSWTYTTASFRQANNSNTNQLDFIVGITEESVYAHVIGIGANTTADVNISVGIGLDSTTVTSANLMGYFSSPGGGGQNHFSVHAIYEAPISAGRHFLAWLEFSVALGTTTWSGTGSVNYVQSGINGHLFG